MTTEALFTVVVPPTAPADPAAAPATPPAVPPITAATAATTATATKGIVTPIIPPVDNPPFLFALKVLKEVWLVLYDEDSDSSSMISIPSIIISK